MRDHSHYSPENSGYCAHCGQLLVEHVPHYGNQRVSPAGLAVTVLLHVLLLLLYVFYPEKEEHAPPPSGADITYIKELPGKPKLIAPPKAVVKPKKVKQRKPEVVKIERLPDTITLPEEKLVKREEPPEPPEPPKPEKVAPAEDMSARIAARQAARAQERAQQGEESEADRGKRIALANIESANGKSRGDGDKETNVRAVVLSFNAANLDFKGWDPVRKRHALQRFEVELGLHYDIQTASIKKMVQLLRAGGHPEVQWTSDRLNKKIMLSMRPEDTPQLEAFLYQEMFPGYRRREGQ